MERLLPLTSTRDIFWWYAAALAVTKLTILPVTVTGWGPLPDARGILCRGVPLSSSARRLAPIIKGNSSVHRSHKHDDSQHYSGLTASESNCNITNGSPSTGSSRRLAKHLNCVSQQCDLTTLGGRRALYTQRERFAHCRKGKRLVVAALWNGDIWANLRRLPRGMGVSGQICQKKL